MLCQKGDAVESPRESLLAKDSIRPVTQTTTDCFDENSLSNDTDLATDINFMQPTIALTRLRVQAENQQQDNQAEPEPTSQDFITTSATSSGNTDQELNLQSEKEEPTTQVSVVEESPAEMSTDRSKKEPDSEPAATEEEEKEVPATTERNISTGKAKTMPKRRSGRAANRRWVRDVERKENWYNPNL